MTIQPRGPRASRVLACISIVVVPLFLAVVSPWGVAAIQGLTSFDPAGAITINKHMAISHAPVDRWDAHADNLAMTGAKSLRFNIEWWECAREYGKNTTVYNFTMYDNIMTKLDARGIDALGCFVYGWGWWPNNKDLPREDWNDYLRFAHAFVSRYQGNMTYQSWNEPNPAGRSFWRGTELEFFEFLGLLVDTIRDAHPGAVILSPSLVGPDIAYLERMIDHFGNEVFGQMFDVISYHTYSGSNAEIIESKIDRVNAVLGARGLGSKPAWITEVGYSTKVSTADQVLSYRPWLLDFQASFMLKTYMQAISRNVSEIYWYCLYDWCGESDVHGAWIDPYNGEANFGLFTCYDLYNFSMKPSGLAYQRLGELIDGATFHPNGVIVSAPPGARTWAYHFHTARNTTLLVAWNQNLANRVRLHVPGASLFDVTVHEYLRNQSRRIEGIPHLDLVIGVDPVMIELETGMDGPVVVQLVVSHGPLAVALLVAIPSLAGLAGVVLVCRRRVAGRSSPVAGGGVS